MNLTINAGWIDPLRERKHLQFKKDGSIKRRLRDDGHVWCSRCKSFLPAEEFRPNKGKRWDAYCRSCEREYQRGQKTRWGEANPDAYDTMLARWREHGKQRNAERDARARKAWEERRELVGLACRWLLSRGFSRCEVARLARVSRASVGGWLRGEGALREAPVERVLLLWTIAGDLPPWEGKRAFHRPHPAYHMLDRRMAASLEET